jgi:phage shock protein C
MATREQSHTSESLSSRPQEVDDAYEAGATTLNLEEVSDADLDTLSFEDEPDAPGLSLQTLSGLSLIVVGLVYLLTEISASTVSGLLSPATILPWLLGTTVLLVGIALLTMNASTDSEPEMPSMPSTPESTSADSPSPTRRLMRSRNDRKLFGVCGGLAAYLNLDPTLVRVGVVLGSVVFGPLILIYFGLAFAMPKEPTS